ATNALRSQGIDRQRCHEGGIDAARKSEHDALETVLVHVIAQSEHAGEIVRLISLLHRDDDTVDAAPAIAAALPAHRADDFAKGRELKAEPAIGMQTERGAVEHEHVLAAHLVDIDHRHATPA